MLSNEFKSSITDVEWIELWKQLGTTTKEKDVQWYNFKDKLEFLNDLSF